VQHVRRALVSVSDKAGVVEFARGLAACGFSILSTGGTAALLAREGIAVTEVSAYTGFPEMLDGRVKTLHPRIHAGLLARRDDPKHQAALAQAGFEPIELLVVNLYPFQATVAREDCTLEEAVENIDIGGPAMLRAAAKNYGSVAAIVDPADYPRVLDELRAKGAVSAEIIAWLMGKSLTPQAKVALSGPTGAVAGKPIKVKVNLQDANGNPRNSASAATVSARLNQKRRGRVTPGSRPNKSFEGISAIPGATPSRLRSMRPRYQAKPRVAAIPIAIVGSRGRKTAEMSTPRADATRPVGPPHGTMLMVEFAEPSSTGMISGFMPSRR